MRSFHAFSWKLVYPAGLDSHASPCRIELRERWRAAMCVYEKMRIDFFFLIKEHKALKNNCLSLQHFTLHTKAQPPLPQEAERRFAQDNTTAPFWPHLASLCSNHFPLWKMVFLICFGEEKAFSLIYLLSRNAQSKWVNVYKVYCFPGGAVDRIQGVAAPPRPHPRSVMTPPWTQIPPF